MYSLLSSHNTHFPRGTVSAVCPRHVLGPASLLGPLWTGAPQSPALGLTKTHVHQYIVNDNTSEKKTRQPKNQNFWINHQNNKNTVEFWTFLSTAQKSCSQPYTTVPPHVQQDGSSSTHTATPLTMYGHTCVPGPNINSHCLLTLYICPGSCCWRLYGVERGSSSRHSPYPVLLRYKNTIYFKKIRTGERKRHKERKHKRITSTCWTRPGCYCVDSLENNSICSHSVWMSIQKVFMV